MKLRRASVLALAVCLAACESSTEPGDELSSSEAGALAAAILDLTLDAGVSESAPAPRATGPATAPVTFDYDVQVEGPCPLGGTMDVDLQVAGSFDSATQQGQLDLDVDAEHHGCKVKAEDTDQIFTLDGAPGIRAEFHLVSKPDQSYTLSGRYDGDVDWASDGRSGTCRFDLQFSGAVSATTGAGAAKLTGTACGVSIDYDVSG